MSAAWSECTGKYKQVNCRHLEMRSHVHMNRDCDPFFLMINCAALVSCKQIMFTFSASHNNLLWFLRLNTHAEFISLLMKYLQGLAFWKKMKPYLFTAICLLHSAFVGSLQQINESMKPAATCKKTSMYVHLRADDCSIALVVENLARLLWERLFFLPAQF